MLSALTFATAFTLFCINLALCGSVVFIGGLLKFIIPFRAFREALYKPMHAVYRQWAINNGIIMALFNHIDWQISGVENLSKDNWYLFIANHQSWLDILVLAIFANKYTPEPKFFLKDSLKKIPFLGMACWALEMPFMKRYSKAFIEKHPELKGKDIETTKASCQAFEEHPTSIINFVEGTRFTKEKHSKQESPFKKLLKPKAGGIAFTLAALGHKFDKVLNITLIYPDNTGHVMKDMLKGRLRTVVIHVEQMEVSDELVGDYFEDADFKENFQVKLNDIWQNKDLAIERLTIEHQARQSTPALEQHLPPLGR